MDQLKAIVNSVIASEGPVKDEVLARRIARAHGWSRTGARIHERVAGLAMRNFERRPDDTGNFFWPKTGTADRTVSFRRPRAGQARVVDEIPFSELSALAAEVRRTVENQNLGLQAMAHAVGLTQLRTATKERLERAWLSTVFQNSDL